MAGNGKWPINKVVELSALDKKHSIDGVNKDTHDARENTKDDKPVFHRSILDKEKIRQECLSIAASGQALLENSDHHSGRGPFIDLLLSLRPRDVFLDALVERLQHSGDKTKLPADKFQLVVGAARSGQREMMRGKHEMVEANLRLVVSVAREYSNRGMLIDDLVQQGNMGLMKAAEKFNYRHGLKFSTCAVPWINLAIGDSIPKQGRTIEVPTSVINEANILRRAERHMRAETGCTPTVEELAAKTDKPVKTVNRLLSAVVPGISLQDPIGNNGLCVGDRIVDNAVTSPLDSTIAAELRREIEAIMRRSRESARDLTDRQKQVLRLRFGIGTGVDHSTQETSKLLDVTDQCIIDNERKALKKLKGPAVGAKLRDFVFA